jgi:hypothetical protein
MVLQGWEVKALREGKVQLTDGYVVIRDGELFLLGCQINPLKTASTHVNPEPCAPRSCCSQGRDPPPDRQGRAKGLHPGAAEPALESRLCEMRNRAGQGQGRARQARHHQGPRRQARGGARHEEQVTGNPPEPLRGCPPRGTPPAAFLSSVPRWPLAGLTSTRPMGARASGQGLAKNGVPPSRASRPQCGRGSISGAWSLSTARARMPSTVSLCAGAQDGSSGAPGRAPCAGRRPGPCGAARRTCSSTTCSISGERLRSVAAVARAQSVSADSRARTMIAHGVQRKILVNIGPLALAPVSAGSYKF